MRSAVSLHDTGETCCSSRKGIVFHIRINMAARDGAGLPVSLKCYTLIGLGHANPARGRQVAGDLEACTEAGMTHGSDIDTL